MNYTPSSLAGRRIVVTRAADQADELDALLRERGAEPLPYPCIAIAPPEDTGPLNAAMARLLQGGFDWLVLTSRNTVSALAERLALTSRTGGLQVQVAAVGTATAEAAERELGLRAQLIPEKFVADALLDALAARLLPGDCVLLCQADIARPILADALRVAGADVTSVIAYRTAVGSGGVDLPGLLARRQIDAIVLTSASTARNLVSRLQAEGGRLADLSGVCIACIGPVTADAAEKLGLAVGAAPAGGQHTIPALVASLEAYFRR